MFEFLTDINIDEVKIIQMIFLGIRVIFKYND